MIGHVGKLFSRKGRWKLRVSCRRQRSSAEETHDLPSAPNSLQPVPWQTLKHCCSQVLQSQTWQGFPAFLVLEPAFWKLSEQTFPCLRPIATATAATAEAYFFLYFSYFLTTYCTLASTLLQESHSGALRLLCVIRTSLYGIFVSCNVCFALGNRLGNFFTVTCLSRWFLIFSHNKSNTALSRSRSQLTYFLLPPSGT
jgi:hypothetical protein